MIRTALVACLIALPSIAAGQTPVDWHKHVSVLDPGDRVNVRTMEGTRLGGRVVHVDAEGLTLTSKGQELRLPAVNVRSIERPDSVWSGALIGLTAGFGTGVVMMSTCDPGFLCDHTPRAILGCGTLTGGFGFGVGLLIDAIVRGDRTVFRRSERGRAGVEFEMAPIVTPTRKGLAVRLGF